MIQNLKLLSIGYSISVNFSDLFRKVVLPSSTESDLFRQSSTTDEDDVAFLAFALPPFINPIAGRGAFKHILEG